MKSARKFLLPLLCVVAVLTAALLVVGVGILKQSGENPPVVPPVGETQDAQTPAEWESETDASQNSSYSTDLYTVAEIDGKHYINFVDGNDKPATNSSGSAIVAKGIYFNSIEEMRQKFLTGKFSALYVFHSFFFTFGRYRYNTIILM